MHKYIQTNLIHFIRERNRFQLDDANMYMTGSGEFAFIEKNSFVKTTLESNETCFAVISNRQFICILSFIRDLSISNSRGVCSKKVR